MTSFMPANASILTKTRKGGLPKGVSAMPINTPRPVLKAAPTRTTDMRERNLNRQMKPITDPNSLDRYITPGNTLRNQRIGYGVTAPSTSGSRVSASNVSSRDVAGRANAAFEAQLPQMMQSFRDEIEGLTARTAAMGRTGSGMFNRDTDYAGDRALAARESLLGNLIFSAETGDANRALQAAMANQSAGLQAGSINANLAQADAARQLQVDLGRQAHLAALQGREDRLAREAMSDRMFQMNLLQNAFGGQPTGAVGQAVNAGMQGSGQFGANAGMINSQLANGASQLMQFLNRPQTPAPSGGGGGVDWRKLATSAVDALAGGRPSVINRTEPFSTRRPSFMPPIRLPDIQPVEM